MEPLLIRQAEYDAMREAYREAAGFGRGSGRLVYSGRIHELPPLDNQLPNHITRYISQPEVAALETVGQFGVIDAHLIQDGGV
jgi:hypothetical protein